MKSKLKKLSKHGVGVIPLSRSQWLALSKKQRALANKHGTPIEFSVAVWRAVPGDVSATEAAAAILKYNREWTNAA